MNEIESQINENSKIAIIAAPTLFCHIQKHNPALAARCVLLEFDRRFSVYGDDFVFYDINEPLGPNVMECTKHEFDFILADPPFWLEKYLTKLLETVDYLGGENAKILICAGPPMIPYMTNKQFSVCPYRPTYERRLSQFPSNQSRIYSNYTNMVHLNDDNSNDEITY